MLDFKNGTKVMGIINATPDSFSGDGTADNINTALNQAKQFIADGAEILDIGGQSTRPGADLVGCEVEINRVVPVIKAIRAEFNDITISIDTYHESVARNALDAGADIINDVWGGKLDPFILKLAKERNCPICLMHNRSKPNDIEIDTKLGGQYNAPDYNNFMQELLQEMHDLAKNAIEAGVKPENIILDPGVGFGKTVEQNMCIINRLGEIKDLGFPVLLGASRKSFIGQVLDLDSTQRLEGTLATTALGIIRGADIVRVHDVKENARVAKMTGAMLAQMGE